MDLTLSDEQTQLRATYAQLFERECPSDAVRRAEAGEGWMPALWLRLVEIGAADLAVPEADGGQGAGLLDCALVAEEAGRRLAPVPLIEAVVVGRLLARLGPGRAAYQRNVEGAHVVTLAQEPASQGHWRLVPWGAVATALVGRESDRLVVLRRDSPRRRRSDLGGGAVADWDLGADGAEVDELCSGAEAVRQFALARADTAALVASWLTGLAAGAVDLAIAYTSEREAFGVPVASFQAVAHRLADLATCVDGGRLLAQEAAWLLDEDEAAGERVASMGLAYAARTAIDAASACVHLHGGYGFMLEYDPQLFFRRAMSDTLLYGAAGHEESLSARLFVEAGRS
jgi:alkylation response protein AidB-like acyl-CoA dehydrogenase